MCELASMLIKAGYWRQGSETNTIFRCPNMEKCLGGRDFSQYGMCADGHQGVLCQVCRTGHTFSGAACYPCSSRSKSFLVWACSLAACGAAGVAFYYWYFREMTEEDLRRIETLSNITSLDMLADIAVELKCLLERKLKVVVSFYQVVTVIPVAYPVDFDVSFQYIIGYFNFVNLQINEILPVTCLAELDYYSRYLLKAFGPLGLTALFYASYNMTDLISLEKRRFLFKLYLLFLFAIYPAMTTMGGESLRCLQTSDKGQVPVQRWLKVDYGINCESETHKAFLPVDILFMLFYSFGIPGLFFTLLWQKREELSQRKDRLHLPEHLYHLEALCITYEKGYWWFEVAECFRKYLLVSVCISVFQNYPSSAILMAIVFCVMTLLVFQRMAPYEFPMDDILAYIAHCVLLIIFLLAAYTRFSNIVTNITSEDVVGNQEVYLWEDLVVVASYLVLFIFIIAIGTTIYEVGEIWKAIISGEPLGTELPEEMCASTDDLMVAQLIRSTSGEVNDVTQVMPTSRNMRVEIGIHPDGSQDAAGLEQRIEAIGKQIARCESQRSNLTQRISELETVLTKARKRRDKATRKLEAARVDRGDSDSDSEHHAQIVEMHESALKKATVKYDACQAQLTSAKNSLQQCETRLTSLDEERSSCQERLAAIREEEKNGVCPACGAPKNSVGVPRLTPRTLR